MTNDQTAKPISAGSVTALALVIVGALMCVFLYGTLKYIGMLLAVAALIVGIVAAINAPRRNQGGVWLARAAIAIAAVTIIGFIIWAVIR